MSLEKEHPEILKDIDHDEEMTPAKRRASSHAPTELPASLRGMSDHEIQVLGGRATLKKDIIVYVLTGLRYVHNTDNLKDALFGCHVHPQLLGQAKHRFRAVGWAARGFESK
jgi:hypothetical protein